jgi:hypothetical protein
MAIFQQKWSFSGHYRNVNKLQQHKTYHWIDISLLCLLVYNGFSIKKIDVRKMKVCKYLKSPLSV